MTLISSRMTFVSKRVFPAVWFGFLALFVIAALAGSRGRDFQPAFLIMPVLMAVIGFVIMKKLLPLSNIMNVSYMMLSNPPRVTLTLRNPGLLGKEITFSPPVRWIPFARSPIVDQLIERIDAARAR